MGTVNSSLTLRPSLPDIVREAQVVGITGLAAADQARLLGHMSDVLAVANAARLVASIFARIGHRTITRSTKNHVGISTSTQDGVAVFCQNEIWSSRATCLKSSRNSYDLSLSSRCRRYFIWDDARSAHHTQRYVGSRRLCKCSTMDKRGAPRHKCFLRAFVYIEGRATAVNCVVRDISDIGARLQFDTPLVLTELLDLHIPIKGQRFHAEKRWHNGDQIGVAFNATTKANTDDTGVDRRVDRLKEEIAVLKKAIKHLQKTKDDQNTEAT